LSRRFIHKAEFLIDENPRAPDRCFFLLTLFGLFTQTMISILQPVTALSLLCISIGNVATSLTLHECTNPHLHAILASLPFAFLQFGLAALAASHAAKTRTHLVGCGSGCLLGEIMYCFVAAGVAAAQIGGDKSWVVVVAGVVTLVILFLTVLGWSLMCSYPKVRNLRYNRWVLFCPSLIAQFSQCLNMDYTCFVIMAVPNMQFYRVTTSGDGDRAAAAQAGEVVVTNPVMAHLINISSVSSLLRSSC
jgi:hypothetical protein